MVIFIILIKYKELINFYIINPASKIRIKYISGKIPNQRIHSGNIIFGFDIILRVEKSLKKRF